MTIGNKEKRVFRKPQGFRTIRIRLTQEAMQWLAGTTSDENGREIPNLLLFYDLLGRMRLTHGRDFAFRRPQPLQPGEFQFSETTLAADWGMGRKKVRNILATMERLELLSPIHSRTASTSKISCVEGWTTADSTDAPIQQEETNAVK